MSVVEFATDGPAAPPRANGELVFSAPWQSRVFGLTAALVESGRLSWPEFQQALIERVGEADRQGRDDYWGCWSSALGDLCHRHGLVTAERWDAKSAALADRPVGHDHGDHEQHEGHRS